MLTQGSSPLKLRLQAVATYENLLIKAKELEVPAEITLELAKKLLDYLVLCFARGMSLSQRD